MHDFFIFVKKNICGSFGHTNVGKNTEKKIK